MIKRSLTACVFVAAALLALGCALSGLWLEMAIVLLVGLGWWTGRARRRWAADGALAVLAVVAARAVFAHAQPILMLVGLAAALSAWDLDHFSRRLEGLETEEQTQPLVRGHLRRLAVVVVAGLVPALAALSLRVRAGEGLVVVLGLLAVVGISQAVRFLRQQGR